MTTDRSAYWQEQLQLQPHPEGGCFKETYRSAENIERQALPERYGGSRSYCTGIYFMLRAGEFSAFHRIQSDEMWHFYDGDPLTVSILHENGSLEEIRLGRDHANGEVLQAVVPRGVWFGSRVASGGDFALVGCTVAPGFDFADFEMAERTQLTNDYPQHKEIIAALTAAPEK